MNTEAETKARVEARRLAKQYVDLMLEELEDANVNANHFWAVLRDTTLEIAPLDETEEPFTVKAMTDDEARKFGNSTLGFGKYADVYIKHIPDDYLEWMADNSLDTTRKIRAYLESL